MNALNTGFDPCGGVTVSGGDCLEPDGHGLLRGMPKSRATRARRRYIRPAGGSLWDQPTNRRRQVAFSLKTSHSPRMRTLPHFADLHGTVYATQILAELFRRQRPRVHLMSGIHKEGAFPSFRGTPPIDEPVPDTVVARSAARERAGQRCSRVREGAEPSTSVLYSVTSLAGPHGKRGRRPSRHVGRAAQSPCNGGAARAALSVVIRPSPSAASHSHERAALRGRDENACADGLGEHERVARFRPRRW